MTQQAQGLGRLNVVEEPEASEGQVNRIISRHQCNKTTLRYNDWISSEDETRRLCFSSNSSRDPKKICHTCKQGYRFYNLGDARAPSNAGDGEKDNDDGIASLFVIPDEYDQYKQLTAKLP